MRVLGILCGVALLAGSASADDKIPITTASPEARAAYLKGRELTENLRGTDAYKEYAAAVAKDKDFALAHLGMAQNGSSAKEFFDEMAKAVALADKVSEPERLLILGADAGAKGDPVKAGEIFAKLVSLQPSDERAHNQLGNFYFGQQEYDKAIAEYRKATDINPKYPQPYNQLGYALRFTEKYADAEAVFKKYVELIPNDPNPYDSYAELLMKMGKLKEAIAQYEKALTVDKHFASSYVGIANCQMFMDHGAEARAALARLTAAARNDAEKRQALFWNAVSYLHEGAADKALAEVQKEYAVAEASGDLVNLANDVALMGNILLNAGKLDQAAAKFKQQLEIMDRASAPAEVKAQVKRNHIATEARIALARKDLAAARAQVDAYGKAVAEKKNTFELRQWHELAGMVALEDKKYDAAVAELDQANQQDPRVLYNLAVALDKKGDKARAKTVIDKAADFNGLAGANYAFVRKAAKALKAKIA